MDKSDITNMLISPYYAINLSPDLTGEHEPLISREKWIEANLRLLDEIGAHEWLERLLAVLQGDYPVSPNASYLPDGYITDDER